MEYPSSPEINFEVCWIVILEKSFKIVTLMLQLNTNEYISIRTSTTSRKRKSKQAEILLLLLYRCFFFRLVFPTGRSRINENRSDTAYQPFANITKNDTLWSSQHNILAPSRNHFRFSSIIPPNCPNSHLSSQVLHWKLPDDTDLWFRQAKEMPS